MGWTGHLLGEASPGATPGYVEESPGTGEQQWKQRDLKDERGGEGKARL